MIKIERMLYLFVPIGFVYHVHKDQSLKTSPTYHTNPNPLKHIKIFHQNRPNQTKTDK